MDKKTQDMVMHQLAIAREALEEMPTVKPGTDACTRLRTQLALSLDSIEALVRRETA